MRLAFGPLRYMFLINSAAELPLISDQPSTPDGMASECMLRPRQGMECCVVKRMY